jgi:hypothetical protein
MGPYGDPRKRAKTQLAIVLIIGGFAVAVMATGGGDAKRQAAERLAPWRKPGEPPAALAPADIGNGQ